MAYVKVAMEAQVGIDYIGVSTDTDPTGVPDGTTKYDTDTGLTQITKDGGTNWVNFTKPGQPNITVVLADDDSHTFPAASSGYCVFAIKGDYKYDGAISWTDDGSFANKGYDTSYVKDADTDGYLCIIQTGTQVSIKNRLGSEKTLIMMRMVA